MLQNDVPQDQEETQEVNVQQTMVETVVAVTFVSVVIFLAKAVGQAIAGWLGLTLFKKMVAKYKARRNKNGKGDDLQVPDNEPTKKSTKFRIKSRR